MRFQMSASERNSDGVFDAAYQFGNAKVENQRCLVHSKRLGLKLRATCPHSRLMTVLNDSLSSSLLRQL
jgi:hypothetical protein